MFAQEFNKTAGAKEIILGMGRDIKNIPHAFKKMKKSDYRNIGSHISNLTEQAKIKSGRKGLAYLGGGAAGVAGGHYAYNKSKDKK